MIILVVLLLASLLVAGWRLRERNDLRRRVYGLTELRRMIESTPTRASGLTERRPDRTDHVRILAARPAGMIAKEHTSDH